MTHETPTSIPRLAIALVGAALIVVAFLRGNYLLGMQAGVAYALVASALIMLLARAISRSGNGMVVRLSILFLIAGPVSAILAYPAMINSNLQYFIDKQAIDRRARTEFKQVQESDAAFADLSISTAHTKIICVTISGELPTREDLQNLRQRIDQECPALKQCWLIWDIQLFDSKVSIDGSDRELFPSPQEAE